MSICSVFLCQFPFFSLSCYYCICLFICLSVSVNFINSVRIIIFSSLSVYLFVYVYLLHKLCLIEFVALSVYLFVYVCLLHKLCLNEFLSLSVYLFFTLSDNVFVPVRIFVFLSQSFLSLFT